MVPSTILTFPAGFAQGGGTGRGGIHCEGGTPSRAGAWTPVPSRTRRRAVIAIFRSPLPARRQGDWQAGWGGRLCRERGDRWVCGQEPPRFEMIVCGFLRLCPIHAWFGSPSRTFAAASMRFTHAFLLAIPPSTSDWGSWVCTARHSQEIDTPPLTIRPIVNDPMNKARFPEGRPGEPPSINRGLDHDPVTGPHGWNLGSQGPDVAASGDGIASSRLRSCGVCWPL
ncbi:uncharacterized protein B0H64DRAFT_77072 [Chaetomium fimeti]|uniref:Uncharacterized protein n=1 Tax=Chaetomium fimeti TaxID=1854472 RepID=A0AAE0HLP5_9PEZI|nr:hypothetical protein B0H64DRAFT_77072 [Chaetomium fimeti]